MIFVPSALQYRAPSEALDSSGGSPGIMLGKLGSSGVITGVTSVPVATQMGSPQLKPKGSLTHLSGDNKDGGE